jgi:HTH-type transcriptional regulator / antitoxin HigA
MTKITGKKRTIMSSALAKVIKHWDHVVAPVVHHPKNAHEYDQLVEYLDELLDTVSSNENHPLMGLVDLVSHYISAYEKKHEENTAGKGIDALKYLMTQHKLSQKDFSEIGSQGVISEILNGKRKLNLRQIRLLADRFHVNPSTFI